MSLIAACPCGQRFQARPDLAGKSVRCPKCGQVCQLPRSKVWLFVLLGVGGVGLLGAVAAVVVLAVVLPAATKSREATQRATPSEQPSAPSSREAAAMSPTAPAETAEPSSPELAGKQAIYRAIAQIDQQTEEDPRLKIMEKNGIAGGAANLRAMYDRNRQVAYQALAVQYNMTIDQIEAIRREGEAAGWPK